MQFQRNTGSVSTLALVSDDLELGTLAMCEIVMIKLIQYLPMPRFLL